MRRSEILAVVLVILAFTHSCAVHAAEDEPLDNLVEYCVAAMEHVQNPEHGPAIEWFVSVSDFNSALADKYYTNLAILVGSSLLSPEAVMMAAIECNDAYESMSTEGVVSTP